MVIGSGLVARAFNAYKTDDRFLIFASGVSDSTNINASAFSRERALLIKNLQEHKEKIFVYFSTCSTYDAASSKTPYVLHKAEMEKIVIQENTHHYIFRISNLVGRSANPHTVLNFFIQHIVSGTFFYLWKGTSRNIIDIEDAFSICHYILQKNLFSNKIINIASPISHDVMEIVKEIENFFGKKGNYEIVEKPGQPVIDISNIQKIIIALNINFNKDYLRKVINKYFSTNDISAG